MSGFRKKSFPIYIAPPEPVIEIQSQTYEEKVGDEIVTRVAKVPVDMTSPEAAASLPTYKEYYLEELLKAGVPLDQINVSNYYQITDSENLKNARISALARLGSKVVEPNNVSE